VSNYPSEIILIYWFCLSRQISYFIFILNVISYFQCSKQLCCYYLWKPW